MKNLSKQIIDALEAGGFNVSSIASRPTKNGKISVSLLIQSPADAAGVIGFIRRNAFFSDDSARKDLEALCLKKWSSAARQAEAEAAIRRETEAADA